MKMKLLTTLENQNGNKFNLYVEGEFVEYRPLTLKGGGEQRIGAKYYIDTILESNPFSGLSLCGGVPAWDIDANTFRRSQHLITKEQDTV